MKLKKYGVLTVGLLLILVALIGNLITREEMYKQPVVNTYNNSKYMMSYPIQTDGKFGFHMGTYNNEAYKDGEILSLEELKDNVKDYLKYYQEDLAISDIFAFENSEYYFSIIEEETGRGAMELLVNPYTGQVYPEFGPNMMWNVKYGMHGSGGMMQGRGRMGRWNTNYESFDEYDNVISSDEAYNYGMDYLKKNSELSLDGEFHEFYGYYTFHVIEDGLTIGMLSVNGLTGDVWYHDWHGKVIEVISIHGNDEH